MRKALLLAALLVACSKTETPPPDTAAAMAPAPANLTAADLSGTWNGSTKMAGSDSVISKWTVVSTSDSTGTLTYQGTKITVPFKTVLAGDSAMVTSAPFVGPGAKKGSPKVVFKTIARVQNGQMVGTADIVLAAKPDSVLAKHTFVATRP